MDFLLASLLIAVGLNALLFLPAFFFKTDKLTDFSYALSFAIVAVGAYVLSSKEGLHTLLLGLVLAWSLRLGSFLVYRIHVQGRDNRFDEMRSNFFPFLRFWLAQGLSAWVILLAALFVWRTDTPTITALTWVGIVIFVVGLVIEAVSDLQKFKFSRHNPKKTWIDSGLWRMSRHPNYFGEISLWTGMYLAALSSISVSQALWALASPLFIAGLLLFISGIPILEKSADKKWGGQKAYKDYKQNVPLLVPTPRSIARLFK